MDGHALAISRRKLPLRWGLPGGKVDPGETPEQAIVREVSEEVGVTIDPSKLVEIYRAVCPGEVSYDVITYFYDDAGPLLEECTAETGLQLAYFDIEVLCRDEESPFASYNRAVLQAFAKRLVDQMKAANTL